MSIILGHLLLFSFCCSLVCVAINNAFAGEEMIFSALGDWLDLHCPFWFCKILFACLPCMASLWGSCLWLPFQFFWPLAEVSFVTGLLLTPAIILMVSGFNILASAIIETCKFYSNDGN